LHPGVAIAGLFRERIEGWKGIPQSYECTEFLDFEPHRAGQYGERRVWITTVFAHPIGAAVMLPGFGARHREWMLQYPHMAVLTAMVHDVSSGHVGVRRDGRPRISYELADADRAQLRLGMQASARLLFAAGAARVLVPATPAVVLERPEDAEQLPDHTTRPHGNAITSVHPLGTLCMGDDPRSSVVRSTGEHHQVEALFVLDGSLFPTSIGVPPQISIYSFARHLSKFVAQRVAAV
jgi:choline dehydrogenase-like flavoprotein